MKYFYKYLISRFIYNQRWYKWHLINCFQFTYTSSRIYLIVIWHMELIPTLFRTGIAIAGRSKSLCIFEYAYDVRGVTLLFFLHMVPLGAFRVYKKLVFSFCIYSLFTREGNLIKKLKLDGMTLPEYKQKQHETKHFDLDKEYVSSDSD